MPTFLVAQQTTALDPTLFAAAVVTVIAAIGSGVVQIINATSAARDRREAALERKGLADRQAAMAAVADATAKKADELILGTAKIHELTNSTNSNLTKALEVATQKIAGLERLMAQMDEARRVAAAERAAADLHVALLTPAPGVPAAPPAAAPQAGLVAGALLIAADKAGAAILSASEKTDAALLAAAAKTQAALVDAAGHTDAILSSIDVNTATTAAHTEPPVPTVKGADEP